MTTVRNPTRAIRKAAEQAERDGDGLALFILFKRLADRFDMLAKSSGRILDAWESIDEEKQVPDEINENSYWDSLRDNLINVRAKD